MARKRGRNREGYIFSEGSPAFEAFRNFSSALMLDNNDREAILVTSSVESEGKTTASLNLAVQFASAGRSVLLIDGNFQSPAITEILNLAGQTGISDLVKNDLSLTEVVSQAADLPADVIGGGVDASDSLAAYCSDAFKRLLREAKTSYDKIVIDGSSVAVSKDFLHLSEELDRIVFVVAPEIVGRSQLLRAKAQLQGVWDENLRVLVSRHKEFIPCFFRKWVWRGD